MDLIGWMRGLGGKLPLIDSRESLEETARLMGVLPFFPNCVKGLSVEEMCAPGMLFGGNYEEGCWEWKGPVIRRKTSAYGKFFMRKAGFVSLDLLPDFLNYRRKKYPVKPFSTEEMLLDIIRENGDITSTELKNYIFGGRKSERKAGDLPEGKKGKISHPSEIESHPGDEAVGMAGDGKRKGLEAPLQRLQMGGWILISDFQYKMTKKGERYGWGVARYSTPEYHFPDMETDLEGRSADESLKKIIKEVKKRYPRASEKALRWILK